MTDVGNVQAPVETLPDGVDSQRGHWLQAFHPPIKRVTAPQIQEAAGSESIMADFVRQHSASGYLAAHSVSLQSPYSVSETDLSALLDTLCQDTINADITRVQGVEDVCFYLTQIMTANYASVCVQVVKNDTCRAIAEAIHFSGRTYPHPYKAAMLTQLPYDFESQQITTVLTAMETHPDYADIHTVESSSMGPYLFSEHFMSYGKAYGLCEWLKVEQYQNP